MGELENPWLRSEVSSSVTLSPYLWVTCLQYTRFTFSMIPSPKACDSSLCRPFMSLPAQRSSFPQTMGVVFETSDDR